MGDGVGAEYHWSKESRGLGGTLPELKRTVRSGVLTHNYIQKLTAKHPLSPPNPHGGGGTRPSCLNKGKGENGLLSGGKKGRTGERGVSPSKAVWPSSVKLKKVVVAQRGHLKEGVSQGLMQES